MSAKFNVTKKFKVVSIILVITLLTIVLCSSVAYAAPSTPDITLDPSATADAVPVIEPRGCWAWGPGKIFLVSSLVTLSLAILISLVQANRKFKDK